MLQDYIVSGVLDEAALRCRVIAFDRPGFGYSERPRRKIWTPSAQAELIHEALRQLGIDRAVVVGHSWGTLVSVALALNHPQVVRSLVLLAGFYFPRFRFDVLLASPPAVPFIGDVLRYTISPIPRSFKDLQWSDTDRVLTNPYPDGPPIWRVCASLNDELSQRHAADHQCALAYGGSPS